VHNGGDLAFGPDGYLYLPIGDGGPDPLPPGDPNAFPGDPSNYSQRIDDMLGGILRLDVDSLSGIPPECEVGGLFTIPPDNPYVSRPGCDEIWATGMRNPWRMSFDRQTGDLWIADVGEWLREEVNLHPAGDPGGPNYGWHCYEGTIDYSTIWPSVAADCGGSTYTFPLFEIPHAESCSISGGFVYRGNAYPSLRGQYLFADFCSGRIWRIGQTPGGTWERVLVANTGLLITTFGEDAQGELYVAAHLNTTIYKLVVP
jgi:glucose/arabinose dehydrogenase